jgi:Putative restriction endonuclease
MKDVPTLAHGAPKGGLFQVPGLRPSRRGKVGLTFCMVPCYVVYMSALPKIPVRMTVAEFLAWNPPSAKLWQLVDGDPQAMAPASITHGAIQSELSRLIANHLDERSSPCRVVTTPGVIPRVQSETNIRIPDLAVA